LHFRVADVRLERVLILSSKGPLDEQR
jgi:hypothetical protein